MTQRERHTPEAGAAAPACAAGPRTPSPTPVPARNGCGSVWEDLFHRASGEQQQHLLALAARQGVVYAHQIAPGENGTSRPQRRTLLPALLNGQTKELEAVRPPPVEPLFDPVLDRSQREAVARAVHTPDICLIQGSPGTGKSRVVAEIILQAVRRGQRVMFVAPATAALDRVLEQLAGQESVCPARCLTADESLPGLPPCVRRMTLPERQRYFQEHTIPTARLALASAQKRCDDTRRLETVFAELDALVTGHRRTLDEIKALGESRAGCAAAVAAEFASSSAGAAAPRQTQRTDLMRQRDEAVARVEAQLLVRRTDQEKCRTERERLAAELAPLVAAQQRKSWWASLFRRGADNAAAERSAALQAQLQTLDQESAAIGQDIEKLLAQRRQVDEQFRADETRLLDCETARRHAEIDARVAELTDEQRRLEERWHQADVAPDEMTLAALQAVRERWAARLQAEQQEQEMAAAWVHGVEDALTTLPQRLAACANVVAAAMPGLANDPHFGDRAGITFDLLILDEAEQVTESEFVNVARRANRWVLVGQPMPDVDAAGVFARRSPTAKPLRPAALRPGFFQRLWNTLHGDPRRLPCTWAQRDGRLSCCLHAILADHQKYVEKEHVADRPDIELCIVAPPRRPSYLAEVVFPAGMSIHEAKEYIFREMGELSVQAHGHSLRWSESSDRITLQLGPAVDPDAAPVALEPGVCELVGVLPAVRDAAAPWHTCGLAFDREAGWTLERSVQWVETHLKTRDLGRTAFLATPYRMHARLAQVLDDLLFEEFNSLDCPRYAGLCGDDAALEFVAVPAGGLESEPHRRGEGDSNWGGGGVAVAAKPRTVKGGAGFEIDLADPRRLEPLPAELRAKLPAEGLVNFLEAQAVVRALEALVADPALFADGASRVLAPCQRPRSNGACMAPAGCNPQSHCPAIAVVALYPAQAALISLLVQRSPTLTASGVGIEVGTPAAFRQRECRVALVSLTRSHTNRAVSFGDGNPALVQALTRAAARVVVFGDPGTLWRRSQWGGELDQQEETEALKEQHLTGRLLRYIQGQGAHTHAFQLREGNSA